MKLQDRLSRLEWDLSASCPRCGAILLCQNCEPQTAYDLHRLTVEEMRTLRALLAKALQQEEAEICPRF